MAYSVPRIIDNEQLATELKLLATEVNAQTAANAAKVAEAQADNAEEPAATQGETYVEADAQSVATLANSLQTDFNALLAKLRTAGLLAE